MSLIFLWSDIHLFTVLTAMLCFGWLEQWYLIVCITVGSSLIASTSTSGRVPAGVVAAQIIPTVWCNSDDLKKAGETFHLTEM